MKYGCFHHSDCKICNTDSDPTLLSNCDIPCVSFQASGAMENVSVLVIRLNTDRGPSLARLRPNRQAMSVDDVEAAAAHEAAQRARRAARAAATTASTPTVRRRTSYIKTSLVVGGATSFSASEQSSTTNNDMSESGTSTPQTPTTSSLPASEVRADGSSEESKTPTSSFMSSGHTMRMSFSTGDEMDNDDDKSTLTNSSGGSEHNEQNINAAGAFVRDVIRIEPASIASTSTSVGQHSSISKRYASAAVASRRETDGPVSGSSNKRPPPIAPKPRFVKKNGGPGNSISNGGGFRDSISRTNPFPVTWKTEYATCAARYDVEEDDQYHVMHRPPGGVSPSADVARMMFETEDSSTSIEDHDDAKNKYHHQLHPQPQRKEAYSGGRHAASRIHAADIFSRQPPQPTINRQLSQPESMSFGSPPRNGNVRLPAAVPGRQEVAAKRQLFEMNDVMSKRDYLTGRPYQRRSMSTPPTSHVGKDPLTTGSRFNARPSVNRGTVVQSQHHGHTPDFDVVRF